MEKSEHWKLIDRITDVYIDVYMSYPPHRHPFTNKRKKIA